jgi:hypothetical protein
MKKIRSLILRVFGKVREARDRIFGVGEFIFRIVIRSFGFARALTL